MYTHCLCILFLPVLVATFAQDHDLRLSNIGGNQGRVEVLNNGQWGTICKDGWNFFDALVVCKQLGFPWLARNGWKHDAGNGTGPVWLSNVECKGSETRLDECANDGWMEHQCVDVSYAAAVTCLDEEEFRDPDIMKEVVNTLLFERFITSEEGVVVLNLHVGRRLIFLLCDKDWDLADADVICRQMGFHSAHRATTGLYLWRYDAKRISVHGRVSYLAANISCVGNESHILQCPAQAWFQDDCPNGNQAGIVCNRVKEPEDFEVRLVNGANPNEGRLEVYLYGTWGSVCVQEGLASKVSDVICQQLGLGYSLDTPFDNRFGRSSGPVVISDWIYCSGGESSLAQCSYTRVQPHQECSSQDNFFELNVICSGPVPEHRSPIKLSGALHIFHDGRWGLVCGDYWSDANTEVACRELGFKPSSSTPSLLYALESAEPMILSGVSCTGDEDTLDQCRQGEWYTHPCPNDTAIFITCSAGACSVVSSTGLLLASLIAFFYSK